MREMNKVDCNKCTHVTVCEFSNTFYEVECEHYAPEVVPCNACVHQVKHWHKDGRMKAGGYYLYRCELNEDPFVAHAVDGLDGEFCSSGERRMADE